jgi:hypothetical protein
VRATSARPFAAFAAGAARERAGGFVIAALLLGFQLGRCGAIIAHFFDYRN